MSRTVRDGQKIDDEAAAWLVAIDCGTADREAFERWRTADPAHALAFIRASQVGLGLDLIRETGLAEPAAPSDPQPEATRPSINRRRLLQAGAAGTALLGLAGLGWSVSAAAHDVRTAIGERRRIVIDRDVTLDLNTNTHLRWRRVGNGFHVQLLQGELLLDRGVGSAPCTLTCQGVRVVQGAGRVDARLRPDRVDVFVLHGEAIVHSAASPKGIRVASMQRTTVVPDAAPVLSPLSKVDVDAAGAWQRGEIEFHGEALDAAVEEYNRYLTRPMVIADPSIGHIRLGGRFSNSDPSEFLGALTAIYGVKVAEDTDRIRLGGA